MIPNWINPNLINLIDSFRFMDFKRSQGRKMRVAQANRIEEVKNESTPANELPIRPKEKAQMTETIPR